MLVNSDTQSSGSAIPIHKPDIVLEPFGQQDSTAFQTPFLFCYALPDSADIDNISQNLRNGLSKLTAAFPWVAGNVINEDRSEGHPGVWKIRTTRSTPDLVVKDYRDDDGVADMRRMQSLSFPMSLLDQETFSPLMCHGSPDRIEDRSPVLVLQVTLIRGGLMLNFSGHHQALDGTGQEQLAFLLNKACRGEAFTEDEIRVGNLSRVDIVELLPADWQPDPNSIYLQQVKAASKPAPIGDVPAEIEEPKKPMRLPWINVVFSSSALQRLKEEAHRGLPSGFVSTDDALTAFIWQSISRARRKRCAGDTRSTIARAVNPRRYLGIPPTYPGYISNNAYSTFTLDELSDAPLSTMAALLRAEVDPATSRFGQATREFATLIDRATDKNAIAAKVDLDTDILQSSWANMRCNTFDFGLNLGLPQAFRRTLHAPVPSLMFFLPRPPNGEIVISMCLREDDLESLKADPAVSKLARFIG